MASSGHCRRCLRLLRDQSPLKHELKTYSPLRFLQTHQFTTSNYTRLQVIPATHSLQPSTSKSAQKLEPKATTSPSTPPPTKVSPTVNTSSSPVLKLAEEVRKRATGFTETYVAYGVTETFVKECARQADYKIVKDKDGQIPKTKDQEDLGVGVAGSWWYEQCALSPTFSTWAQITLLHMYLLTVRFRAFPAAHAPAWHQHTIDHFSFLAEERMVKNHGMVARMTRNKYLKDLFTQWRGLQAGYDEGLVRGDAVMAAAVWRNVFKGSEECDYRRVAEVVAYMRSVLYKLDKMDDGDVAKGDLVFGNPGEEAALVARRSRGLDAGMVEKGPAKYTKAAT